MLVMENQCFWLRLGGNVHRRQWIERRKVQLSKSLPMLFCSGTVLWPLWEAAKGFLLKP